MLVGVIGLGIAAYPLTLPSMLAGVHGFSSGQGYDDGAYSTKSGRQMAAVRKMIDRLAGAMASVRRRATLAAG